MFFVLDPDYCNQSDLWFLLVETGRQDLTTDPELCIFKIVHASKSHHVLFNDLVTLFMPLLHDPNGIITRLSLIVGSQQQEPEPCSSLCVIFCMEMLDNDHALKYCF